MFKKLFHADYADVKGIVDERLVKDALSIKDYKNLKVLMLVLFLLISIYGVHSGAWVLINWESPPLPMDESNVFRSLFDPMWIPHVLTLFILYILVLVLKYRNHNRVMGAYKLHFISGLFMFVFLLQLFSVFQLVIFSVVLRVFYACLVVFLFVYTLYVVYRDGLRIVYGGEKKRKTFIEMFGRSQKVLLVAFVGTGVFNFTYHVITESRVGTFEEQLFSVFVDFLPLMTIFLMFFIFQFMGDVFIRLYYLNRYSEEFRCEFGVSEAEWYGER